MIAIKDADDEAARCDPHPMVRIRAADSVTQREVWYPDGCETDGCRRGHPTMDGDRFGWCTEVPR